MKVRRKPLRILLLAALVSIILVVIGLLTRSVPPISIAAFMWLTPLFIVFTFTDRLMLWLKALRDGRLSYEHFASATRLSDETKKEIESAWDMPIAAAGVFRALTFTLASGLVDIFSLLMDGGSSGILEQIRITLTLSVASLAMAFIDGARQKSIKNPGLFLKIIAVVGAVGFFRGFLLILSGLGGMNEYRPTKALLSSPVWFLSQDNIAQILGWIARTDMTSRILTKVVIPFMFFVVGWEMVKSPTTPDNVDAKNFAAAMVIISFWFGSQWLVFLLRYP